MMFYKETNFKETPLGKIPEDWEVVKLREIVKKSKFSIVDGPFGTQLHSDEYVNEGVPLIRVNNINKDGSFNFSDLVYITEEKFKELKRSAVYPGDIILAKTGATIGKVCIFPDKFEKGLIASSCAKISIDRNKADILYIFYFLLSNLGYSQILALATGTTRPTINLTPISKIQIILPKSLEEQHAISIILLTVDKAIQKVDEIIAKTERLKKGLMQELLTKGIGHKEFKDSEIGRIPKEWEVVRLGDVATISSGNTAPQEEKYFENGKYPFIRVKHLTNLREEKYPEKYDLINDLAISELKLKRFKKGSVVFPKSGESLKLEKRAVLEEDAYVVNHLAVIEPVSRNLNGLFLFYYLCTTKTSNYLTKTTMPSLNLSTIKRFLIPLPPLPEQQKIAEILSTVDKKIELERKRKEKLERIKKGLMNDLLIGRKRVNVEKVLKVS